MSWKIRSQRSRESGPAEPHRRIALPPAALSAGMRPFAKWGLIHLRGAFETILFFFFKGKKPLTEGEEPLQKGL